MGSSSTATQKPPGQKAEPLADNLFVELVWAGILAGVLAGSYYTATGITLWIAAILLAAVLFLAGGPVIKS